MTSAEKVAELRQAITAGVARLDRDSDVGEQVFSLLGLWQMAPAFLRRRVVAAVAGFLPLQLLEDAAALDDLLGLLVGAALELRTDDEIAPDEVDVYAVTGMRLRAREVLEQVRSLTA